MKKFRFLTLWLLIIAMAFSPMAAFAEEMTDAEDEVIQEEEIIQDDEVPVDENYTENFIPEDGNPLDNPVPESTVTNSGAGTSMTVDDIKKYNEEISLTKLTQYHKVASVLESLGIYSFVDKDGGATVTRGEFAKMIADLLNLKQAAAASETMFNDTAGTPYENEIELVCFYGIMNGTGKGTFAPDSEITYKQAVKTIVTALGYAPVAQNSGGYPTGYMKVALRLELLNGANENLDEAITFFTAANLLSLSACTPVLEEVGIEGDGVIYSGPSEKTVLSVYHNIYEAKGVMTDNGICTVENKESVSKESCVIGGKRFFGMKNSYRDYLGCNVRCFYTTENGYDELLYATTEDVDNNIVNISAGDLLTDDSAFNAKCVVASVNGKRRVYNTYRYADYLYNGAIDDTVHNDSLKIKQGYLTLIDADGDNYYELVKIWEYSDIVVDNIFTDTGKILSKYGEKEYGNIEYGNYDSALFVDSYGIEITPEEIPTGCVLSVFRAKNDSYIKLVLSTETADIEVSSVESDDTVKIFYDDKEAELSYTYQTLNKLYPGVYPTPVSGQCYKVYFNYDGLIAVMIQTDGKEEYAYALAMAYGKGIRSNKVDIKLYFESDSWAVVPVANKITINGVKNKTGADLMNDERIYKNGAIVPQLVKIILNSKGELTWIWIDNTAEDSVYGFNLDEFSLDYYSNGSLVSDLALSGLGSRLVQRRYRLNQNTKVFIIDNKDSKLQVTDEDMIHAVSYNEYIGVYSGGKHIKMYDADYTLNCGAVVVSQSQGLSSRTFTVDKVSHIIDEEGEEKVSLAGFYMGTYRVVREAESGLFASEVLKRYPDSNGEVKKGDVWEIYFEVNGAISIAKLYYSPQRDKDPEYCFVDLYNGGTMYTGNQIYILGYPVFVDNPPGSGGMIGVYSSANPDYVPAYNSKQTGGSEAIYTPHPYQSSIYVLKYDCAENTLEKIAVTDIPGVAQANSTSFEITDKTTKVYFRKTSGLIYDLLLVTNIGN